MQTTVTKVQTQDLQIQTTNVKCTSNSTIQNVKVTSFPRNIYIFLIFSFKTFILKNQNFTF